MPYRTFAETIDNQIRKYPDKEHDIAKLTVDVLYIHYIQWINSDNEKVIREITLTELLFQIQVISAYVEYMAKIYKDKASFKIIPVPEHIKNQQKLPPAVNDIIQEHFKISEEAIKKPLLNTMHSHTINGYTSQAVVAFGCAGLMIALGFLPHLPVYMAVITWIFGSILGASAVISSLFAYELKNLTPEQGYEQYGSRGAYDDSDNANAAIRETIENTINPNIETNDNKTDDRILSKTTTALTSHIGTEAASAKNVISATVLAATKTRYHHKYAPPAKYEMRDFVCSDNDQTVDLDLIHVRPKQKV